MILLVIIGLVLILILNQYIIMTTRHKILSKVSEKQYDCILILGAGIWGTTPSPMLADRLDEGIRLYKEGIADKIIMSGDHRNDDYDEVSVMKDYAIKQGVPSSDIFKDHLGLTTYESIYRAKNKFKVKKMIIVTQRYHLYRALYIADRLKIEADGKNADLRIYSSQLKCNLREIIARVKAFVMCIYKPEIGYLGDIVSIYNDGDMTNNKE